MDAKPPVDVKKLFVGNVLRIIKPGAGIPPAHVIVGNPGGDVFLPHDIARYLSAARIVPVGKLLATDIIRRRQINADPTAGIASQVK